MESIGITIMMLAFIAACIGFTYWIYRCVWRMAKERHRDAAVWLILSFIINPFFVILILYFVGDADD